MRKIKQEETNDIRVRIWIKNRKNKKEKRHRKIKTNLKHECNVQKDMNNHFMEEEI